MKKEEQIENRIVWATYLVMATIFFVNGFMWGAFILTVSSFLVDIK